MYYGKNMGFIHKIIILLVIIFVILMTGALVYGQDCDPSKEICRPTKAAKFEGLLTGLAEAVVAIGIPLVGIFLVYAGFLFVTAGGDEKKLETAKTTFYWTIIGAVVLLGSSVLARAIVDLVKRL